MAGGEIELEDAIGRATANRASVWPSRTTGNRLEPECWPVITPRFQLKPGSTIFTIGSCFARSVESALEAHGFDIPTRRFAAENATLMGKTGDEILNKYTPPSIYQELVWTKQIHDRDGIVAEADIAPFLLQLDNGNVVDLQHRMGGQYGMAPSKALELRQNLYDLFAKVYDSSVVVITLGLIECWWDRQTGAAIEFGSYLRRHNQNRRFAFRRLNFAEAYDYTAKAVDLMAGIGVPNILLTTSPVPLARTFTGDDVVVANNYSKSVLRAVAGQIAAEYSNVDYYPSYESVMLTKQSYVWADDLTHVETEFVARVVGRMCAAYVQDTVERAGIAHDRALHFSNLVRHRKFEEAKKLFAELPNDLITGSILVCAAEMHAHFGAFDLASVAVRTACGEIMATNPSQGSATLLRCAVVFEACGLHEEALATRQAALERLTNPSILKSMLRRASTGAQDEALKLIAHAEAAFPDDLDLLDYCSRMSAGLGDYQTAERLLRKVLQAQPTNGEVAGRVADMLSEQERHEDAAQILDDALVSNPGNIALLKKLIATSNQLRRLEQAERVSRRLIELCPEDPEGYLFLASALRRQRRVRDAIPFARRAVRLAPGVARYSDYLAKLMASR